LPMWDAELAAGEIHRLSAKGVHAVTFSENPEALKMPSIHTDFWDPVFTAACDTETVLCTHVGSSSRGAQVSTDAPPSVTMALGAASVLAYAFLVSTAIALVVHRAMGFRIDEEHEVNGIDLVVHAETAYDLHSTAGSRTSGGFHAPKATSGPFAPPGPQP